MSQLLWFALCLQGAYTCPLSAITTCQFPEGTTCALTGDSLGNCVGSSIITHGTLTCTGDVSATQVSNIVVGSTGSFAITGKAAFPNLATLTVDGDLSIGGDANASNLGTLTVDGSLSIGGIANVPNLGTLTVDGSLSIGGIANVPNLGALTVDGSWSIGGDVTFSELDALTVNGNLSVGGDVRFADHDDTIDDHLSIAATQVNNIVIGSTGSLAITGKAAFSFPNLATLIVDGGLSIGGEARVSNLGTLTVDGSLSIGGEANVPNLTTVTVGGSVSIGGDVTFSDLDSFTLEEGGVLECTLAMCKLDVLAWDITIAGTLRGGDVRISSRTDLSVPASGLVTTQGLGDEVRRRRVPAAHWNGGCAQPAVGSLSHPRAFGQGFLTTARGGGRLLVEACGTFTLDGNLSSSGAPTRRRRHPYRVYETFRRRNQWANYWQTYYYNQLYATGGSVLILTTTVEGSGSISCNAGTDEPETSTCHEVCPVGKGGPIAIHAQTFSDLAGTVDSEGACCCDSGGFHYGVNPMGLEELLYPRPEDSNDSSRVACNSSYYPATTTTTTTTTTITTSSNPYGCAEMQVAVGGDYVQAPALPSNSELIVTCPSGAAGQVFLRCRHGVTAVVEEETRCYSGCNASDSGRRLLSDDLMPESLLAQNSCDRLVHGNNISVPCSPGYEGTAALWCDDGVLHSNSLEACTLSTSSTGGGASSSTTTTLQPEQRTSVTSLTTATARMTSTTSGTTSRRTTTAELDHTSSESVAPTTRVTMTSTVADTSAAVATHTSHTTGRPDSPTPTSSGRTATSTTTLATTVAAAATTTGTTWARTTIAATTPSRTGATSTASVDTTTTTASKSVGLPLAGEENAPEAADTSDSTNTTLIVAICIAASICGCGCMCVAIPMCIVKSRPKNNKIAPQVPATTGLPPYWSGEQPPMQGWHFRVPDKKTCSALAEMLHVADPSQLGAGKDAHHYDREYNGLQFYSAWRVEYPDLWQKYMAESTAIAGKMAQLRSQGCQQQLVQPRLRGATAMPGGCDPNVNEVFLLSGTKPENVLPIISQGLKVNVSRLRGLLGTGIYFAEDATKIDQYTTPDSDYEQEGLQELHRRLFRAGGGPKHPDQDLFYVLVVRVVLGWSVRTLDARTHAETDDPVFRDDEKRELATVPGSSPPVPYHSAVLETGERVERFREFVIYTNAQCYIEYLVAYKRV